MATHTTLMEDAMLHITQTVDNHQTILTLSGRFHHHNRQTFLDVVQSVITEKNCHHLTVNLTNVQFIDSSAIGLLYMTQKELALDHIGLSLVVPPGHVLESLELMRMDKLMPIYATESAVLLKPVVLQGV